MRELLSSPEPCPTSAPITSRETPIESIMDAAVRLRSCDVNAAIGNRERLTVKRRSNARRRQRRARRGRKQWPIACSLDASRNDRARKANKRSGTCAPVLRTACGQRPYPFVAIDLRGCHADDLADARANEKLNAQRVSRRRREARAFEPGPERSNLLLRKSAIPRLAMTVSRQALRGIRWHDVERHGPLEQRVNDLPRPASRARMPCSRDGFEEGQEIALANIGRRHGRQGRQHAPENALDIAGGAKLASDTAREIEADQLLDGDRLGSGLAGVALFGNEIAALPRGAGQFASANARFLETGARIAIAAQETGV